MPVFAVVTAKGPTWDAARGIREQHGWNDHAVFFDGLVSKGVVLLGGPIEGCSDEDVALLAVCAADERELQTIFSADPWAVSGVLSVKHVRRWTLWLDSRGTTPARAENGPKRRPGG